MKLNPDPLQDPQFSDIIRELKNLPQPEASPEFTDRVMSRLHKTSTKGSVFVRFAIEWAAVVALLLGAGLMFKLYRPKEIAQTPTPVEILMAAQRDDGGWSADTDRLRSRYDVAVSSLVLLALAQNTDAAADENAWNTIRSGVEHLLRQQSPDGRFGIDFSGAVFNQYLAIKALETVAQSRPNPDWQHAIELAKLHQPSEMQMSSLNRQLANPATFPHRWAEAAGPAATAIQMLKR